MFNHRRDYIAAEPAHTLFDSVDVVKNKILAIIATRVLLDKAVAKKLADSSGDSPQKKLTRDKAIKLIGNKARACAVYFEEQSEIDIATVLKKPKTHYDTQKDEDIATVIDGVRTILFNNSTPLAGYGVNTDYFTNLDIAISKMNEWLPKPAGDRQSQYAGDAQIDQYITTTDTQYIQLDSLVINAFEDTNPDIVKEYLATDSQTSVGVRHNIVDVTIKLLPLLTGINRGKIDVTDTVTGEIIKTIYMDAYGAAQFFAQNKPFYATASADGCAPQTRLFHPLYRGTFHLDFEMVAI